MSMTPKELIKEVYEIAFGEDAYLRGFFPEEVVARSTRIFRWFKSYSNRGSME